VCPYFEKYVSKDSPFKSCTDFVEYAIMYGEKVGQEEKYGEVAGYLKSQSEPAK
jgi:hypothetical protein